jgi:gliding motility-associated-like protein
MRNLLLVFTTFLTFVTFSSYGQIVGADVFLQGKFLEIGQQSNGALGANSSPGTYHAHQCCGSPVATPGSPLAEVFDYGFDGWTTGGPAFMGDYTYPGSPFEGWEVQMNGGRMQCYQGPFNSFDPIGGTLTGGTISGYSNAGGIIKSYWSGTFAYGGSSMLIKMETRVDTLGSAVVFTVTMYNNTLTAIPDVYYWRSCDPDNDETWPGGSFTTDNVINFQNSTIPNPKHKVMVTASGQSPTLPPLTLCTKDCRAVAVIYESWGLGVTQDLSLVWGMAPTIGWGGAAYYDVGTDHPGDIGIGLVYNIGTIAAGDSAVVSYAYVFNGAAGIDDPGALPDPELVINGVPITTFPDTLDGCLYPGIDSLPIDIRYGDEKDWTWGSWTWSPSTGLSATTGVHNFIHLNAVPGNITYTITGTDSGAHMKSCQTAQIIFTVHSCHFAYSNDPCVGDMIRLGMLGDSLGATYFWYGPGGWTSPLHNPTRGPASFADTGVYHVVRTIGGIPDTDFVHVMVHPLPVVTPMSSIAPCGRFGPENLGVNLDSAGESFVWSGPKGFSSTDQFATINPFDSTDAGTYTVTGTSVWGCKTTASISVWPGITPNFQYLIHRGCGHDTVEFFNTSYNADSYDWDFNDGTAHVSDRSTTHVYVSQKSTIYHVKLLMHNAHGCVADTTIDVDITHDVQALFWPTPDTLCLGSGAGAVVNFTNTSFAKDSTATPPIASYAWSFGDGGTDLVNATPTHTYTAAGLYNVILEVTDGIPCKSTINHPVYVVKIDVTSLHDTLLCLAQPMPLNTVVTVTPNVNFPLKYSWSESSPNLNDPNIKTPSVFGFGDFTDILTITAPGIVPDGCPVIDTIVIHAVKGRVITNLTATSTIIYGGSVQLNAGDQVFYYWKPDDGSLNNPNINNPIATPTKTTVYTVFGLDVNGCLDSAYVTVYVDSATSQGLPTGFTPNGDGVNDVFRPVGSRFDKMVEFRVFNRWGQEMFATNRKDQGWDGTFHGTPQDLGVYYYEIVVATPGGADIVYKGSVTLIR